MTVRRLVGAVAAAGFAAITLVGVTPAGAQADDRPSPGTNRVSTTSSPWAPGTLGGERFAAADEPDGNFYAFEHADFGGRWCSWADDDGWWGDDCGGFDNITSSVWNNGYPTAYSTVKLLKHANTSPNPTMCLDAGDYWGNLDWGYEIFSDNTKSNDQISAHRWIWLQQRFGPYYSCG